MSEHFEEWDFAKQAEVVVAMQLGACGRRAGQPAKKASQLPGLAESDMCLFMDLADGFGIFQRNGTSAGGRKIAALVSAGADVAVAARSDFFSELAYQWLW